MSEEVKLAFQKVKQDIFSLGEEVQKIKLGIAELKSQMRILTQFTDDLRVQMLQQQAVKEPLIPEIKPENTPTDNLETPTNQQINSTYDSIPADKLLSQVLKRQNSHVSIGNRGVPTDRQTNQQTDQHIIQQIKHEEKSHVKQDINHLEKVSEILSNLDSLKKEIRRKFKALTSQEVVVFSQLYMLEDQGKEADYKELATTLSLSESSIRDYIAKIQKKGIPITKEKLNNKKILLHISPELKKIASLDTILKLREL